MKRRIPSRWGPARLEGFRAGVESLEGRRLMAVALVTKTVDDGSPNTFRWALNQVNSDPAGGQDVIDFSIPGLGAHTIQLDGFWPAITHSVFIDGTSQAGYGGAPLICLNAGGSLSPPLSIAAVGCTIQGLSIINADGAGIYLGASGAIIRSNYLGIGPTGTPGGNFGGGIDVGTSSNDVIGGGAPADRNVIAANGGAGIKISNGSSIRIEGNFIGTDPTDFLPLPNQQAGIAVTGPSAGIDVQGNVISGNGGYGISLSGANVSGVAIQGNTIGTDLAGANPLGNGAGGISDDGASGTSILGNLIAANRGPGVSVTGVSVVAAAIQGNTIGTDRGGSDPLGNAGAGVVIGSQATGVTVGGTAAGQPNVIADNGPGASAPGVSVANGSAGCPILGNSIYGNSGPGIMLQGGAPGGGNHGQAFPVLTSATAGLARTIATGTLHAAANTAFRVEFFANPQPDPSGFGQGRTYLGFRSVTTDGSGNAAFTATFPTGTSVGTAISATATDPAGDTSQFAQDQAATPGPPADLGVAITPSATTATALRPLTYTAVVTNHGPNPDSGVVFNDTLPAGVTQYTATTSQGQVTQGVGTLSVTIGDLAADASVTITLTVTPSQAGTATDAATVSGDGADTVPANNSASGAVAILPAPADLQVSVTPAAPGPATVGQPSAFVVDVANLGPGPATGITLAVPVPPNVLVVAAQASPGTIVPFGDTFYVSLASLAAQSDLVFRITFVPTAAGTLAASASVTATTTDPAPGNNQAGSSVAAVQPPTHLIVAASATPNPATAGQLLTFTMTVTNAGPVAATNVVLGDALPTNATLAAAPASTQGGTSLAGGVLTASLGTLAVGASATVTIPMTPSGAGVITDGAIVSADQPESVPGDASAGVSVPVGLAGTFQFGAPTSSGPENSGVATILVTRTGGSGGTVTVHYATADGTGVAGINYLPISGDLTFGPGVTSRSIQVPLVDDHRLDGDHTVILTLSNPTNGAALGGQSVATLTVTEADRPGSFQIAATAVRVNQHAGTATITVDRVGGSDVPATISFGTADSSALAGVDYRATSGTLAFGVGVTRQTFTIPILNRGPAGLTPRSLFAYLVGPTGGATIGGPAAALVTITAETTSGDFDGSGKSEFGTYDPVSAGFAYLNAAGQPVVVNPHPFGVPADHVIPLSGDFDGAGKAEFGIYDPTVAVFAYINAAGQPVVVNPHPFGVPADHVVPLTGDFDGSGRSEFGIYDPVYAVFAYINAAGQPVVVNPHPFGVPADHVIPLTGDFDGSGRSEFGIYDPTVAVFAYINAAGQPVVVNPHPFGVPADHVVPLTGDFDGTGKSEFGIYDPTVAVFAYINAAGQPVVVNRAAFGVPADHVIPLTGDFDGLGKAEFGIYDPMVSVFAYIGHGQTVVRSMPNPSHHPLQPVPAPTLPSSTRTTSASVPRVSPMRAAAAFPATVLGAISSSARDLRQRGGL